MAGSTIKDLKEQVDGKQAITDASMAEISTRQDQIEERMLKVQETVENLILNLSDHFDSIKKQLGSALAAIAAALNKDDNFSIDSEDDIAEYEEDDEFLDRKPKNYTVLTEEDIRRRQDDDIARVSTVLSIPRVSACRLLRSYKWSVNNVNDAWFGDEDRVRESVGLLTKSTARLPGNLFECGICFEVHPPDRIPSLACGHLFCINCWRSYITTAINDGPVCLMLRCPDPSCNAAVLEDLITELASNEDKNKYQQYIVRSYVECNRNIKWCPAPGCDCAVEFDVGSSLSYDVTCLCSYSFCWNCIEEAHHRPVDCDTVAKWILKNSAESENVKWILANSKPCPQCKKPIEKNQGCNHMTCRPPCGFQFCWLCLGDWTGHNDSYACNKFNEEEFNEAEEQRKMAQQYLTKYTHYYERWANNHSARKKAIEDLHEVKTIRIKKIIKQYSKFQMKMEFITEAWEQIIECRRVLKWTYVYGYYLDEKEKAKKDLFEFLQGQAEDGLERLHQYAEEETKDFECYSFKDFGKFRLDLIELTSVTRKFFNNLVRALENDLPEVCSTTKKRKCRTKFAGIWKK